MLLRKLTTAAVLALVVPSLGLAEQGVSSTEVRFAQVAALEGPAAALGQGMQLGLEAAFAEANAAGGVHGRMQSLE